MTEYRKFDLEAAQRGEPIITRDGRKAFFIGMLPDFCVRHKSGHRFCAVIDKCLDPEVFAEEGKYYVSGDFSEHDLFMAPKKRTLWGVILKNAYFEKDYDVKSFYETGSKKNKHGFYKLVDNRQ